MTHTFLDHEISLGDDDGAVLVVGAGRWVWSPRASWSARERYLTDVRRVRVGGR